MHTLYTLQPSGVIHTLHKALLVFQKRLQIALYFLRTVSLTPSQEIYFEINFLSKIFSVIYPFVSKKQSPVPCLIWSSLTVTRRRQITVRGAFLALVVFWSLQCGLKKGSRLLLAFPPWGRGRTSIWGIILVMRERNDFLHSACSPVPILPPRKPSLRCVLHSTSLPSRLVGETKGRKPVSDASETYLTLLLTSSKKNNKELKPKQKDFTSPEWNPPHMIQCRKWQSPISSCKMCVCVPLFINHMICSGYISTNPREGSILVTRESLEGWVSDSLEDTSLEEPGEIYCFVKKCREIESRVCH